MFENMKLGLREPDPAAQSLKLEDYLTGYVPEHPTSADYVKALKFGLYRNDEFGVCGPTSVANYIRLVTAVLTGKMLAPTQADVFKLYRESGNPDFDPSTGADDNGVVMTRMLEALMRNGMAGVKPLGWAKVKVTDPELLKAAVAVFGGQLYGVQLQRAQQEQTNQGRWAYSPSSLWGGHAVLGGKYDQDSIDVVTWAQVVEMLYSFVQRQLSESYIVILPHHLNNPGFVRGMDIQKFAKDWEAFSGKPFPVPLPDPVKPTPVVSGMVTIDPLTKTITYPADWKVIPTGPVKADFKLF